MFTYVAETDRYIEVSRYQDSNHEWKSNSLKSIPGGIYL